MAKSESNRTREPDGKGSAGSATEADVVDQHRELDESQSRPEESMISLEQQIEQQREETAELRALLESRLENSRGEAEAGPGGEILARMGSVERQVESIGADSRVDALMLRIGELERKLSAGTSEPLLNEIAHRLDVLEQGGGWRSRRRPSRAGAEALGTGNRDAPTASGRSADGRPGA